MGYCLVRGKFTCQMKRKGELDVRCRVRGEGRVGGGGEGLRLELRLAVGEVPVATSRGE